MSDGGVFGRQPIREPMRLRFTGCPGIVLHKLANPIPVRSHLISRENTKL